MNFARVLFIAAIIPSVFYLAGCGTTKVGNKFDLSSIPRSPDKATVVFYRPNIVNLFRWIIEVDGEQVTELDNGTFFVVQMPPGKHQFNTKTDYIDTKELADIKIGKPQFFRIFMTGYAFWTYVVFKEEPEQVALQELAQVGKVLNSEPGYKNIINTTIHDMKTDKEE